MTSKDLFTKLLKVFGKIIGLSIPLGIILTILTGRIGCNDGSAHTFCMTWIGTYFQLTPISFLVSTLAVITFYTAYRNFSRRKSIVSTLVIILVCIGIITAVFSGEDTSEPKFMTLSQACEQEIQEKCSDGSNWIESPVSCIENGTVEKSRLPPNAELEQGKNITCL